MAITMDDILASLKEAALRYELHQITQEPVILFPTSKKVHNNTYLRHNSTPFFHLFEILYFEF